MFAKRRGRSARRVSTIFVTPSATATGTCLTGEPSLKDGRGFKQDSKKPLAYVQTNQSDLSARNR